MQVRMMYLMLNKGFSFSTLSAQSGIEESVLRSLIIGDAETITVGNIRSLCKTLQCSIEELFNLPLNDNKSTIKESISF